MRLGIMLLFIWTVAVTILLPHLALSKTMQATGFPSIQMVTITGRAVIQHEDTIDEARDLALEDALYYAALKGGARVDGYSAVDETTSLQEMFIVRPAAQILDYTITNELRDDTHYEVTIQAMVGDVQSNGCQNRPISHVTLFKPDTHLAYDLPHWMSQLPGQAAHQVALALSEQEVLQVRDARGTERPAATASAHQFNKYDYRYLTSGRVAMRDGDIGIVTSVRFDAESKTELLAKTRYAVVTIESHLTGPNAIAPIEIVRDSFKIRLGKKMLLSSLTTLNRESRESLVQLIENAARIHAQKVTDRLICQPMKARLELLDNRLQVRLGTRQGLGKNHLAFTDDKTTKFKILRVAEAKDTSVILEPLDSRQDVAELVGAEVTFMEFN